MLLIHEKIHIQRVIRRKSLWRALTSALPPSQSVPTAVSANRQSESNQRGWNSCMHCSELIAGPENPFLPKTESSYSCWGEGTALYM